MFTRRRDDSVLSPTLADLFRIRANFTRSVNIERDAKDWLSDQAQYILTPLARSILARAVEGILSPKAPRAWTITGPYGTGKSAFSLALTQLLCRTGSQTVLWEDIQREDPALAGEFRKVFATGRRFLPVLISGRRDLLAPALHAALVDAIRSELENSRSAELNTVLLKLLNTDSKDTKEISSLFEETARVYGGVLLIIDELGKFLEYIAQRPDQADVFALQVLAESASRSGDTPFLVFSILHQAFGRYGNHLTQAQREEFTKVQGRFQDVAFNQSHDQMLRLVSNALQFMGSPTEERAIQSGVQQRVESAAGMGLSFSAEGDQAYVQRLVSCAPIHPITALLLGPVFRRLAQNERSLFAFLSSSEPFGLREFLRHTTFDGECTPLYTPDLLYDYVHYAMGTALHQEVGGRVWALIEDALDRNHKASPLEIRAIKTIGLLAAIGEIGELKASAQIVSLALDLPFEETNDLLQQLTRRSAVTYRSLVGTYRLWEGGDVDIEERLTKARDHVDETQSLDELLVKLLPPRPVVARRHSFEMGTLRFYEVTYASVVRLPTVLGERPKEADGKVIYALIDSASHLAEVIGQVTERHYADEDNIVVVPIQVPSALRGAALELERLKWVRDHTQELHGDIVAQRELRSRLYETELILQRELDQAFAPSSEAFTCYCNGKLRTVCGWRGLNQLLSELCNRFYPLAPRIKNELINRRQLSSAATSARRTLLQHMSEAPGEKQLGIVGHPPQLSMYLSLLEDTGIHREVDGDWKFFPPAQDHALAPVWDAWREYLQTARCQRQPISIMWDRLRKPPYGLRDGVVPVFLLAMILERSADIGIYEAGSFISDLTMPHIERLLKTPEKFEIRYCPMDGLRREVFDELRASGWAASDGRIVLIVRDLCRSVAKLPAYAQKTKSVSLAAQRARAALLNAREPDVLLFQQLPEALGMPSFLQDGLEGPLIARAFAQSLEQAMRELQMAHTKLHDHLFHLLATALELPSQSPAEARRELQGRVNLTEGMSIDLRMKSFLNHCSNSTKDFSDWMEAIGSVLAQRPPATWNDEDLQRFEIELAQVARKFNNLLRLAVAQGRTTAQTGTQAVRLGVTSPSGGEQEKVVFIRPEQQALAEDVANTVIRLLQERGSDEENRLAILAALAKQWLPKTEE